MFVDSHCHLDFPELAAELPQLLAAMREHPSVAERVQPLEAAVAEGSVTASQAAAELLETFGIGVR